MSLGSTMAAAVFMSLAVCGCGKPSNAPSQQPSMAETPSPSAAPLSEAQKSALLAQLPAPYRSADVSNGEAKFALCRSCHTNSEGGPDMVGPNLWGVFGRKAGSKPGFSYSDDLKNAGWTWDASQLDKWIASPRTDLPNTKMTFVGIQDPKDRADVIAYLKVSTSPAPAGEAAPAANAANSAAPGG